MHTHYGDMEISLCGVQFPSNVTNNWKYVTCPDCIPSRPPLFKIGNNVKIKGTTRNGVVTDIYDNRDCTDPFLYEKSFYYQIDGGFYWSENALQ